MSVDWVPFGLNDDEAAEYQVLLEGIPVWLREPLVAFVDRHLRFKEDHYLVSKCLTLQLTTRVDLKVSAGGTFVEPRIVRRRLRALDDAELLRIVDYIVSVTSQYLSSQNARELEETLKLGRSRWTVGKRGEEVGLVERVPAGVQLAVEGATKSAGSAGVILARAWALVHGLQPNDSAGYADAVRAVEIAAIDLVQPNNSKATLGTVITQMRDQGDWRLPLREHAHAPSTELLLNALRALWHGHRDRHGSADYRDVTHQARAAVALAASLVEWFTAGVVERRSG